MFDIKTRLIARINSVILMTILFWGLCACRNRQTTPFIPPTEQIIQNSALYPTKSASTLLPPTIKSATDIPRPTTTPFCASGLTYLEDLTIPDGMLVAPGELLDKRWRVQNSGNCNWDLNYRLKLMAGPDLNAPTEQSLYPARSDSEAIIRIIFIAPQEPGTYRSAWEAYDPQGRAFGDPIFIEVVVSP
jgi:hypothetical protein